MTIDGESVERKTAFIGFGSPDWVATSGAFVKECPEGSLGFYEANNSEFAKFLLNFATEDTFQPMR